MYRLGNVKRGRAAAALARLNFVPGSPAMLLRKIDVQQYESSENSD